MFEPETRLRRRSCLALLVALSAALVSSPGALAQEAAPGVFGEVIDVRVVNLEVVVTDRKGDRVTGLKPEDFRLLVDRKEVPIEFFNEVQGGILVNPGSATGELTVQSLPALKPGTPVGTSYLVFVDDYFAIERDRNRVLDSLEKQLPLLAPEDRMALVAFDGRRLTMLSSWSQSSKELERALRMARARPAFGLQRLAQTRNLRSTQGLLRGTAFDNRSGGIGLSLTPEEKEYAERVASEIGRVVSGATATLRSFAMPPGRKVMLLLSGGWPYDPAQVAAENRRQPVLGDDVPRGEVLFKPLADTANLLGYTLYPIDVPGLTDASVDAGEQLARDPAELGFDPEEKEAETGLGYLAARTGGRALLNSANVQALSAASSDTRSYYWLGFTPERLRDDQGHRIKIEVKKPGLRVRSRAGYLDLSRNAEVTGMVESTLLFGSAPALGALPVRTGEPKKAGRGVVEVPFEVAIPVDQITVLPIGDKYVAELELRVASMDENGWTSEIPVIPIQLAGPKAPKAGGHVLYEAKIKLRKGKNDVVLALYDKASGRMLSNRVQISP